MAFFLQDLHPSGGELTPQDSCQLKTRVAAIEKKLKDLENAKSVVFNLQL